VGSGSCRQEFSYKCWTRHGGENWRPAGGFVTPACHKILDVTNSPEQYVLAIVEVVDGQPREPRCVRRPYGKEPDFGVTSVNYELKELLGKSTQPR
jgi:hypothetical protein